MGVLRLTEVVCNTLGVRVAENYIALVSYSHATIDFWQFPCTTSYVQTSYNTHVHCGPSTFKAFWSNGVGVATVEDRHAHIALPDCNLPNFIGGVLDRKSVV